MNTNSQSPTSLWDQIVDSIKSSIYQSYQMLMAGLPSRVPIAGATGWRTKTKHEDQINASKSMRQMIILYGSKKESIGDRRFIRNFEKMNKRKRVIGF